MTHGDQVTVIGGGLMGPGIAACAALAGHPTVLHARSAETTYRGVDAVHKNLAELQKGGLIDTEQVDTAAGLLRGEANLEAVKDMNALAAKRDRFIMKAVQIVRELNG
jgi:3-hydroxyacyl-CoA dehydrogenase